MKLLAIFSIIVSCFVYVDAQERKYDIAVYIEETSISKTSRQIPVKVTITNNAERTLSTKALNNIHFFFSKCLLGAPCDEDKDIYASFIKIPPKNIRENKSFEFTVNLANLFWKDAKIDPLHSKNIKNFKIVPLENIYFYAGIKSLEGYRKKNFGPRYDKDGKLIRVVVQSIPIYKVVNSNIIGVTLKQ